MNKILKKQSVQLTVTDDFATLKTPEGEIKVNIAENSGTEANAIMLYIQFISAYAIARDLNPMDELESAFRVLENTKGINIIMATLLTGDLKPVEE